MCNFTKTMKTLLLSFFAMLIGTFATSAQDWAITQIESSPRHQEWVTVKVGEREVRCFLVYPEVSKKATAVVVIHENRGLNDWARSMTDQIAGAGFIAIAPDLLSGKAPNGGGTADFANSDDARTALYELKPEEVTEALQAVTDYVKKLPAANGKVCVGGFCWGGSQTFRFATNNQEVKAAFVFYGTGPKEAEAYERIKMPVYGFYGGNDQRVNATIPNSEGFMEKLKKTYKPVIYDGAGHGFMRAGQAPDASEANKKARDEAFERLVELLSEV